MDLYELIPAQQLTQVARLALADEDYADNELILEQWFPSVLLQDIDFSWNTGTTRAFTNAMPFRTWTTEAPIGARPGRTRKSGEMPPLSEKYPLSELDRIRQRAGRAAGGNAAEAVEGDVFADIQRGIRAMRNRMEIVRADALVYGSASLAENGVQVTVDFGRDSARESTVGTAWSNAAAATPITDEQTVVDTMGDNEGLGASQLVAIMNRTTLRYLKGSAQYRNYYPSVRTLDRVPLSAVNEVREDHELPAILEYNAQVYTSAGAARRLIPDGMVIYVPRNAAVGETAFGVPAMATEDGINLVANEQPGPIAYMMKQLDPLIVWTVVDAIGFPVLKDPNATYALDVIP